MTITSSFTDWILPQAHLDLFFFAVVATVVASSLSLCFLALQSYHFSRLLTSKEGKICKSQLCFDRQRIKGPNNKGCILICFTSYLEITWVQSVGACSKSRDYAAAFFFPLLFINFFPHFAPTLLAYLHPLGGLVYEFSTGWWWLLVFISRLFPSCSTSTKVSLFILSASVSLACGFLSLVVKITCRYATSPGSQMLVQTTCLILVCRIISRCCSSQKGPRRHFCLKQQHTVYTSMDP